MGWVTGTAAFGPQGHPKQCHKDLPALPQWREACPAPRTHTADSRYMRCPDAQPSAPGLPDETCGAVSAVEKIRLSIPTLPIDVPYGTIYNKNAPYGMKSGGVFMEGAVQTLYVCALEKILEHWSPDQRLCYWEIVEQFERDKSHLMHRLKREDQARLERLTENMEKYMQKEGEALFKEGLSMGLSLGRLPQ
nr:hypothetical protein [Intestinimonas sp.]